MKLSDAMLLGCATTKQMFGNYIGSSEVGHVVACALGAAAIGAGFSDIDESDGSDVDDFLCTMWPWIAEGAGYLPCTVCEMPQDDFQGYVIHLNDEHKLSRENIAAIIAEREESPIPEQQAEEELCIG